MGRALDLTNQRFGKLIALKKAPKQNDKYTRWICQCDCGNSTIVRTDYLRSGHTTSCGCEKNKYFKKYNLIGQKFGYLTVLESLPLSEQKCKCNCGNIIIVKTANLINGNTKSCGCYQKEQTSKATFQSLVGHRFGKLKVLERVENNQHRVKYKCKCDCGGIAIVDANNLRSGNTISCGCIKSKGEMLINNWLQKHHIPFLSQYSHMGIVLESGRRPIFDFAILNSENGEIKCFIEYNGKQHYQATGGWNTEEQFKLTKYRDSQKEEWCKKLGIPLYKIKYDEDIEKILEGIIKESATAPDMEEADGLEDSQE